MFNFRFIDCFLVGSLARPARAHSSSERIECRRTKRATLVPRALPSRHEVRKWIPAKTRASFTSKTAREKLGKDRQTPGTLSESIRKDVLSPKKWASTEAADALTVEWPEAYSGCAGVPPKSGVQSTSTSVVGVAVEVGHCDRGDRTPELVVVLGVPAGDGCVGHGDDSTGQRCEPSVKG